MGKRKKDKKRNKQKFENTFDENSDETFAYIVGYTSGGAPYGVTWEEWENEEEENIKSNNLPSHIDDGDLPF